MPPGYYLDDDNNGVQALKETMRSLWSDLNTGPSSTDDTILYEDNLYNICIRGFPEDYSAEKIHEELELNMKKLVPGYLGNGIRSVQIVNPKRICIVRFHNEDVYQMFKSQYDNFVIGGRIGLYASWYTEPEVLHNFGDTIRTFLGNVVIHGQVDLAKLKKKYPEIIHINQTINNFTIITFPTYDEALYFVLSTKKNYDAAILNFPPPQAENCQKCNLPANSVTILDIPPSNVNGKRKENLKGSDLKLSMILDILVASLIDRSVFMSFADFASFVAASKLPS